MKSGPRVTSVSSTLTGGVPSINFKGNHALDQEGTRTRKLSEPGAYVLMPKQPEVEADPGTYLGFLSHLVSWDSGPEPTEFFCLSFSCHDMHFKDVDIR